MEVVWLELEIKLQSYFLFQKLFWICILHHRERMASKKSENQVTPVIKQKIQTTYYRQLSIY